MTKEEAIKYLQQLYPNGGHCWLDEQRMEAIGIAIKALQEEPVSKDLEVASKEWLSSQLDKSYANYGEAKMMELTHFDGYAMLDAIEFGANWQKAKDQHTIELAEDHAMLAGMEKMKEQLMVNTTDAMIGLPYENKNGGYTHFVDVSRPLPVGNNKIAIIFKED